MCTAVSTKVVPQKRTRQCRLVLWVERVYRWLIKVHGFYQQEKRRHKYICLLFRFMSLKHLKPESRTPITQNIFWHCRVQFCWTTFLKTAVWIKTLITSPFYFRILLTLLNGGRWLWNSTNFFVICFCSLFWPWPCTTHNSCFNTIQYILNWPLPIGAFQGQWNTTKRQNRTTTTVKNPNWLEANQLAIYKCGWEVEPGTTRKCVGYVIHA